MIPLGLLLAIQTVRRILRDCEWQRHGWKIKEEGSGTRGYAWYSPPDDPGTKLAGMPSAIRYIFRYCPPTHIFSTIMLKPRLLFSFEFALICLRVSCVHVSHVEKSCGLTQSVSQCVALFMYEHMAVSLPASHTIAMLNLFSDYLMSNYINNYHCLQVRQWSISSKARPYPRSRERPSSKAKAGK